MGKKESKINNLNKIYDEYNNLVNQIMINSLNFNHSNISNQNISLKIKAFNKDEEINNQIYFDNNFINWKIYLLENLNTIKYDNEWANKLIKIIMNENFDNQYQFKSEIFYEEFKILTCPNKILKQFDIFYENFNSNKDNENNNYENEINIINDNNINFNNNNINDSNEINKEKVNKINLSNYLTGSIISDSSNNSSSNEDVKYIMKIFKKYIEIFHKHLKKPNHPFNFIIKNFCIIFSDYLEAKINILINLKNNSEIKNIFEIIINNIQSFIIDLQTSFKLFYCRTIDYKYIKYENDEIINLITNRIFNNSKFYVYMYKLFGLYYKNEIDLLKNKLELFKEIKPEEIGIKEIFCLNEKTENFIKELKSKNDNKKINDSNENESKENKENDNDNNYNNNIIIKENKNENIEEINTNEIKPINDSENKKLIISSDTNKFIEKFILKSSHKNTFPYENCVKFLNEIKEYKAPFEKMLIMSGISSLIKECVDQYWKEYKNLIKPSSFNIDTDTIIGIIIYIIIKCNNPNLFIHCGFVENFTMQSSKMSFGKNCSTILGCLDLINEKTSKEDFIN